MPLKRSTLGTAQEWLKRAKGNLALAKQLKPKEAFGMTFVLMRNKQGKINKGGIGTS